MSVASAKPIPRLSLTSRCDLGLTSRCDKESPPLRADFDAAHSTTLAAAFVGLTPLNTTRAPNLPLCYNRSQQQSLRERSMQADQTEAAHTAELVARARQGDREAFDGLVELYTPQVYNLALRITGSREEAEDCAQEAFLRAFSALRGFRGEAAFSTWLYRVAVNVANDAVKRRARQLAVELRPLSASELAGSGSEDDPPELGDLARRDGTPPNPPEQAVLQQQRRRAVLQAIRSLPEKHRTVIILHDIQDLSYDQIALVTKTRVGTVKSRLNRARLALKDLLVPQMELLRE